MYEKIYWRPNNVVPLNRLASCLVKMNSIVYAAVWSGVGQEFILFPEDFGNEHLSAIDYWTYYPNGPGEEE